MAGNREFVYRRLHSLLGVIPVGIFLIQHLVVNHFAASGEEAFNNAAHFMENLPFRYALEIFVIFLPLIYHAVYGVYIAFTAKNNANRFGFFRNWMFVLQRITGIITLIFVSWHVWETRIAAQMGAEVNFDMMADILSSPDHARLLHCRCPLNNLPLFKRFMVVCCHLGNHCFSSLTANRHVCDNGSLCCAVLCRAESDFGICVKELDY